MSSFSVDYLGSKVGTCCEGRRTLNTDATLEDKLKTAVDYEMWMKENELSPNAVLEQLQQALFQLLYKVSQILQPIAAARGNRPLWSPCSGTLLGCIRHGSMIPWDDDIDIMVLDTDFVVVMEACQKAGLGIQTTFFGGRIYPYPPSINGVLQGLPFVDVFVHKIVPARTTASASASAASTSAASTSAASTSVASTSAASTSVKSSIESNFEFSIRQSDLPGDLILTSAARELWPQYRIKFQHFGDGIRAGVLLFKNPKFLLPKKRIQLEIEKKDSSWLCFNGRFEKDDDSDGGKKETERVPDQFFVPCFQNPYGYLDQKYDSTWSSVGKIQPSHLDFWSHILWSTVTVVKFKTIKVTEEMYVVAYNQASKIEREHIRVP